MTVEDRILAAMTAKVESPPELPGLYGAVSARVRVLRRRRRNAAVAVTCAVVVAIAAPVTVAGLSRSSGPTGPSPLSSTTTAPTTPRTTAPAPATASPSPGVSGVPSANAPSVSPTPSPGASGVPSANAPTAPTVPLAQKRRYVACMKSHGYPGEIDPWHPPKAIMIAEEQSSAAAVKLADKYRAAWRICAKLVTD